MVKGSPVVRFGRGGQVLELGRHGSGPAVHLYGATGLGVAPVSIEKSDRLAGDGSVVRGVRYGDREVFIPVLLQQPSMAALNAAREDLYRLLAPSPGDPAGSLVEVTVEDPTSDRVRTVRGIYREGLEGDFGDGFHGVWQTLGLVFDCADPWWLGRERTVSLQVGGTGKPFLSDTVDFFPVILSPSAVAGEFTVQVDGDAEVFPVWEITGPGEDLVIESEQGRIEVDGEFPAGEVFRIDAGAGRLSPDRWDDLSLESRLFPLRRGTNHISASMVGSTADSMIRLVWRERWLAAV